MNVLDPSDLASVAASTPDLASFAEEMLDRCQRAVGFDVGYHAPVSLVPQFAATHGISSTLASRMLERGAAYTRDLMPVKRAAYARGGVAIDSEVFSSRERASLSYFVEAMAPDGGRHAMIALGLFGGTVVSVTMLGRTGAAFSRAQVRAIRSIVPVLGLATVAHRAERPSVASARSSVLPLSRRDRDLVDYVALGFTNAEIGQALGTSPRTVRNQLSALYARVGAANRAELVAIAGSHDRS